MVSLKKAYQDAKDRLKTNGIESYNTEAIRIFEHLLKITHTDLLSKPNLEVSNEQLIKINNLIDRRIDGYPLQYLIGEWEFYGLVFKVGEGVLIPRQETETLCEAAIDLIKKHNLKTALDLCSGSGCIPIVLNKSCDGLKNYALEKSDLAINYLSENIKLNNADITLFKSDVLEKESLNKFPDVDIITCNPPYLTKKDMSELQREVSFEPEMALFGGDDGLDFYRKITSLWKDKLNKNGFIVYEIGLNQEQDVKKILIENGFINVCFIKDLYGIIRIISGQKAH